jgi:hypothetical protein
MKGIDLTNYKEDRLIYDGIIWTKHFDTYRSLQSSYGSRVLIYRYIYEKYKSAIPKKYVIHHINNNHKDNRLENLSCITQSEHVAIHNSFYKRKENCPSSIEKMRKSLTGRKLSKGHREKISSSISGENNPMYGKKHSEESKRKMSNSARNRAK